MEIKILRTCKQCGNTDEYSISKFEAAFSTRDKIVYNKKCSKCDSHKYASISYPIPDLDKEILDKWGNDPKLFFMDQDEDLILAEENNLPLFLEAIDNKLYPQAKLNILLSAICVLACDNIVGSEEYTIGENRSRKAKADKVLNELLKRKHLLTKLNWEIMDYIKEIVFPRLDININT